MKPHTLALCCLAQPALADLGIRPGDCPAGAVSCFVLADLAASPGRPVVVDQMLVVVGMGPGPTGTRNTLMAVGTDLSGLPVVSQVTDLDAMPTEQQGIVEISPDGSTYAVFTHDERDHLNRNRRTPAVQFFDETGERIGRVTAPYMPNWPEALEWSPADVFERLAGTNTLRFAEPFVSVHLGNHAISTNVATGDMSLLALGDAVEGDLVAGVETLLDPVGYHTVWMTPAQTVYFNEASDGTGAALYLTRPGLEVWPDVLGYTDAVVHILDPNPSTAGGAPDYLRSYRGLTVSPDWSRLAVIRLSGDSCDVAPVAYEILVYDTVTAELVWSHIGQRQGSVAQDLVFTEDNRLLLTEARGAIDPACRLDRNTSPSVAVTIFDLAQP